MREQTRKVLMSSKKANWRTPSEFKEILDGFGAVGLDPAGHPESLMSAEKQYLLSKGENGLTLTWYGHGLVFVNPPYGKDRRRKNTPRCIRWFRKALRELRRHPNLEIIFLIAGRPDTTYFQEYVFEHAQALCWWRGRLKFIGSTKSGKRVGATFPSAVVYFGPRPQRFKRAFAKAGAVQLLNAPVVELVKATRERRLGRAEKAA